MDVLMAPTRVGVRFDRWLLPLAWLTGMWPSRSAVTLAGDEVEVQMGWAFRAQFPAASVRSARRARALWWAAGVGVHGLRGTWTVNGSLRGIVELRIDPPARARALGVPVLLRRLLVSVTDPDAVLAALPPGSTKARHLGDGPSAL